MANGTTTPTVVAPPALAPDVAPSLTANPPQTQVQAFGSDEPLWYQGLIPGSRWAQAGYAVPNLMGKLFTLNLPIAELFKTVGRNLFEILHEPDVRFSKPPNVKLLAEVHQLVMRARQIIGARAIPPNQARFDPQHAQPNPQVFIVYPIPYFGAAIRQPQILEWAGLMLALLSEMSQHTDNEYAYEITTDFGGMAGQYFTRMYFLMAVEFFGYSAAQANAPGFTLSPADFANYNPNQWFTSVEMTDERFDLGWQPTSNDLRAIRGLPANQLVGLCDYPSGQLPAIGGTPTPTNPVATSPANPTGSIFPTAPGPSILIQASTVTSASPSVTVPAN